VGAGVRRPLPALVREIITHVLNGEISPLAGEGLAALVLGGSIRVSVPGGRGIVAALILGRSVRLGVLVGKIITVALTLDRGIGSSVLSGEAVAALVVDVDAGYYLSAAVFCVFVGAGLALGGRDVPTVLRVRRVVAAQASVLHFRRERYGWDGQTHGHHQRQHPAEQSLCIVFHLICSPILIISAADAGCFQVLFIHKKSSQKWRKVDFSPRFFYDIMSN